MLAVIHLFRHHADRAGRSGGKDHTPGHFGEDSVVVTDAGAGARPEPGASLPDQNRPGGHNLAAKTFYPQPLRLGIAAIPACS